MLYHILAVGDVVMEPGLRHLERHLRPLQKWKAILPVIYLLSEQYSDSP